MIRALIFDCFGVLYRDELDRLYDLVPLEKSRDLQDIIHACDHGFISRSEYFERVAELAGVAPDVIREIDLHQFGRNDQLIDFTKELRGAYKIGVLSNIGDETMDRLFPEPERSQLFDEFLMSSQVGVAKPALQIFEMMAAKMGMRPEECAMIDDRLVNVDAAEQTGMKGILYTTNRQLRTDLDLLLERGDA